MSSMELQKIGWKDKLEITPPNLHVKVNLLVKKSITQAVKTGV